MYLNKNHVIIYCPSQLNSNLIFTYLTVPKWDGMGAYDRMRMQDWIVALKNLAIENLYL